MHTESVARAAALAATAHQGQFRRDGTTPYIDHPRAVASRVTGDVAAECAAWLHDVLEDTNVTEDEMRARGIPEEAISCVKLLTKNEQTEYEPYLAAIKAHPTARKVKIADMLANLSDSPTEKQIVKYCKGLLFLLS